MLHKGSPFLGLTKLHIRLFQNIPAHELRITFPTMLTIARMILVPFIVSSMFLHAWGWAFTFFLMASCTDFLDGTLARRLQQKTFLGACLDPIADKLLLVSFFFTLVFLQTPLFQLPLWFVLLLLAKEMIVVCGALFILLIGRHLDVQPTILGKLNTVVQMVFIMWLFACYYFHWMPIKTYYCMLGGMVVMTLLTCGQYVRIGCKQLGILWAVSILCIPYVSFSDSFIIERTHHQKAHSLRSLKREYGTLFGQQLRISATILKEIGVLQNLLIAQGTELNVNHYTQKIDAALVSLNEQLVHIYRLRNTQVNLQQLHCTRNRLVQQCAYMVECMAMIQSMLIQYIEQLVEGDEELFNKKRQAALQAEIVHHRADLHAMQSLLELLQLLQKECKVVQKNTV